MKHRLLTTSQPPDHVAAFQRAAKAAGMTLSEWVGQSCLKQIQREERAKLTIRRRPGGEKKAK
jgi:hypothetical protein